MKPTVIEADRKVAFHLLDWAHGCGLSQHALPDTEDWAIVLAKHREAAVAAALPVWRPIESEPRDGTTVLLWDGENVGMAAWDSDRLEWVLPIHSDRPSEADHLYVAYDHSTHWMPLPQPPTP